MRERALARTPQSFECHLSNPPVVSGCLSCQNLANQCIPETKCNVNYFVVAPRELAMQAIHSCAVSVSYALLVVFLQTRVWINFFMQAPSGDWTKFLSCQMAKSGRQNFLEKLKIKFKKIDFFSTFKSSSPDCKKLLRVCRAPGNMDIWMNIHGERKAHVYAMRPWYVCQMKPLKQHGGR